MRTWFYVIAWVPTLLLADALIARREGRRFLSGKPAFTVSLFAWSVPFWLAFELANLRLANWFYVSVPGIRWERWAGIVLSFATVFPAILVSERLLGAFGVARGTRTRPLRVTADLRRFLQVLGLAGIALSLLWPRFFFSLIWGAPLFVADPFVHRRDPAQSLLGDLERGRPGRIVRLLLGGLAIGLLWELYNAPAAAKWMYTVPGFEEWKLFEMPLAGFLGFPVFALAGYAAWQALVVAGLATPREEPDPARRAPRNGRLAAAFLAALFVPLALLAMERGSIASTRPHTSLFPLATFEGLGTENATRLRTAGITTVDELAAAEPGALARELAALGAPIPEARLRVWVRAAREEREDQERLPD